MKVLESLVEGLASLQDSAAEALADATHRITVEANQRRDARWPAVRQPRAFIRQLFRRKSISKHPIDGSFDGAVDAYLVISNHCIVHTHAHLNTYWITISNGYLYVEDYNSCLYGAGNFCWILYTAQHISYAETQKHKY